MNHQIRCHHHQMRSIEWRRNQLIMFIFHVSNGTRTNQDKIRMIRKICIVALKSFAGPLQIITFVCLCACVRVLDYRPYGIYYQVYYCHRYKQRRKCLDEPNEMMMMMMKMKTKTKKKRGNVVNRQK